jgi:glutamate formiminotransferase / 5-formyltetrahydrofolate cyclo-ligase
MPDLSDPLPLLAVPNVSEGRDTAALDAVTAAFTTGGAAILLDRHSDTDHHRAVLTLTGRPGRLAGALVQGAAAAVERIDVMRTPGKAHPPRQHPHVGAIDVVPLVYLDARSRGAACAEALVAADRIGHELGVPVFLYGELAGGRTRAQLRRGGVRDLAERMAAGEQRPDFGPPRLHPTAGATLVAAREPLVAFNLELRPPATVADAKRIAALIREDAEEGLPGLRAIGVALNIRKTGLAPEQRHRAPPIEAPDAGHVAQVSMNVERPLELPLARVVQTVAGHAEVAAAEIVGLVPRAALEGFPADLPIAGFDPARQIIESVVEGGAAGLWAGEPDPSHFRLGL